MTEIKAFKAFNHDFTCRDYQYEVGKTYEIEGDVEICENGFHACENPFDIWEYYPIINNDGKFSRYAHITASGDIDKGNDKFASAKITINLELTFPEFIKSAVNWIIEKTKLAIESKDSDLSDNGKNSAQIGSSGDSAQIGSSGHYAQIGSSGDSAQIGSSGHSAQIGSSGDSARIGSSGGYARILSEGEKAVIACAGRNARVKGRAGTWIAIPEFNDGDCIGFVTGCIGEDGLEEGVFYIAKNGKLEPCHD